MGHVFNISGFLGCIILGMWIKAVLIQKCNIQKKEEARVAKERREKAWQKDHAYDDVFTEEALEENFNDRRDADFYDDFM